ncbi:alternative ribosome rescue aminoacyl-tRNA hydrolase ArfB [Limibacterium fermenti]|uniref:alternative ribosome rescue aminoacyl-tRNA hydrolase ArfB n=1 Tax=Limibacterium fermenti TaxID=3229863 RepID=UPI0026AB097B
MMSFDWDTLINECTFTASRSSGSGGQNVNKVSTKITLSLNIGDSKALTERQKELIFVRLKNRINNEGVLLLSSDTERTQLGNKKAVLNKLEKLLENALREEKKRVETKPTRASQQKRIESKKHLAEKKKRRSDKGF